LNVADPSKIRIDLHLHTRASRDCLSDPLELLERAERLGIQRLAVTDHDRLSLALELHGCYPDRVIPGEEVRTAEGIDVIGLYLSTEIPKGTPARETCRLIREDGGIVYLPHPFARGKGGSGRYAEELAPLVDVVEVFNARLHPGKLNGPAEELARKHGKLRGAGSDAHTPGELGGAWVELPAHRNEPQALLTALGTGRVWGETGPLWLHVASTWAKIRKRLPGGR
jgi:predicted metal-dependent phosphoesterase TrpH